MSVLECSMRFKVDVAPFWNTDVFQCVCCAVFEMPVCSTVDVALLLEHSVCFGVVGALSWERFMCSPVDGALFWNTQHVPIFFGEGVCSLL